MQLTSTQFLPLVWPGVGENNWEEVSVLGPPQLGWCGRETPPTHHGTRQALACAVGAQGRTLREVTLPLWRPVPRGGWAQRPGAGGGTLLSHLWSWVPPGSGSNFLIILLGGFIRLFTLATLWRWGAWGPARLGTLGRRPGEVLQLFLSVLCRELIPHCLPAAPPPGPVWQIHSEPVRFWL